MVWPYRCAACGVRFFDFYPKKGRGAGLASIRQELPEGSQWLYDIKLGGPFKA
jgi:hypothetical protein